MKPSHRVLPLMLATVGLVAGACNLIGAPPTPQIIVITPAPAATVNPSPTASPPAITLAPTVVATAAPTSALTAAPTVDTASPSASASEPAFPTALESTLLRHIPEGFRAACSRSTFGSPAESVATIGCSTSAAGGDISITYNLFQSPAAMDAAYVRTLEFLNIEARDRGDCAGPWPAEHVYTIRREEAGRVGCADFGGVAHIISWTDTRLNISGYAEGFEVDKEQFYDWWLNESGPVS